MVKVLKILGIVMVVLLIAAAGVYAWASTVASRSAARTIATHVVDFPIPFPIDAADAATSGLTGDALQAEARNRAAVRGEHLVAGRYACRVCHGDNFGGGVMVDDPLLGHFLAPNLTLGAGSRTTHFIAKDWDRIVRHGVRGDGHPAVMPSEDFKDMSDQELSDIVTFIRTQPPVDNTVAQSSLGPLGKLLAATGKLTFAADAIPTDAVHLVRPPEAVASTEFGKHLAAICTGCHGADLSGGPIVGGDPAWPPARNLTPDETGLKGWTFAQFVTAITEAKRPNGTALRAPMGTLVPTIAKNMTDVERQALWAYLQGLPAVSKKID